MATIRRGAADADSPAPRAKAGTIASNNGNDKHTPAPRKKVLRDSVLDGMQVALRMNAMPFDSGSDPHGTY
jgi:hypothetical protein